MAIKLSQLAESTGCRLHGDDCLIENVADINHAVSGHLVFVYNPKYLDAVKTTKASAIILKEEWVEDCVIPVLLTDNPRLAFAKAATLLNPVKTSVDGIARSAVIAEDAVVPDSCNVGHNAVIHAGVRLGENVSVGACSVISEDVQIGDDVFIHPNVTIGNNTQIGNNCTLYSGVVIGADGFGYVKDGDVYIKVPQIGNVIIGNDVDIGANTSIDRGALLDTIISDGVKLDNQIQVAHNVEIGKNTVISAGAAIAGSAKIGDNCLIGGMVGIRDNIKIVDNVVITGRTFVSSAITEPGSYSSSMLLDDTVSWKKNVTRLRGLDDMARRLKKIEKNLDDK